MQSRALALDTCRQLLAEQIPNLMRLYLNPYVAQTCLCLERYVRTTWRADDGPNAEPWQTFLANSFDEALSGAIKLARYAARVSGRSPSGLVLDAADRLGPFASTTARGAVVEFLSGLCVAEPSKVALDQPFGFIVSTGVTDTPEALRQAPHARGALLVQCVDRAGLDELRSGREPGAAAAPVPDIVVFDESFTNHDVPFGAFTARQSLFDHWNKPDKSTFHSTTFQPNSISTLHFMRCLERADPTFHAELSYDLGRIVKDVDFRMFIFRRLYSPSLARAIRLTGFDTADIRARGDFVHVDGRPIFDAVGGVACSVRGHNPPSFAEDVAALDADADIDLAGRLRQLTGLEHMVPAVSGASAVENALKLALVAQHPRRHVLALKSGFGGKTLLALTGTWNAGYKENLEPLYPYVTFVDPQAPDALSQIDAVLDKTPVAVVQMELVQGVGGVRRVPEAVVRHLDAGRAKHGYLLLIDEVQTGMHRTGPFTHAETLGLKPDLLIVGKAISDMMFPFALTLYSQRVQRQLEEAGSTLPTELRERHRYPLGYKTALSALRFAERTRLSERVAAAGTLFADLLRKELASCKAVREVRVFGLLIGIELDASRWPQRWFRRRLYQIYLAAMLRDPHFPVLVGFCQCEPNVLKITPPLTVGDDDIKQMCATIGTTLRRPFYRLLASAMGRLLNPFRKRSKKDGRTDPRPALEPQAHASALR